MKRLKWSLRVLASIVTIPVLTAAYIAWDGLTDDIQPADLAVVLGNKVERNGLPSLRLQARLDRAVTLYQQDLCDYVLVSGGIGVEGFDEAQVMKAYLTNAGIPDHHILTDSQGNNTFLTAKHTAALMDQYHLSRVIVVSQFYHLTRSRLALRRFGLQSVYSTHADYFEARDLYGLAREVIALYWYLVRSYPQDSTDT